MTPLCFSRLNEITEDRLVEFFERTNVPTVTETFRGFELTAKQAKKLYAYRGYDEYFVAQLDCQIVGFGMLRGWDEGFSIPSFGVFVDPSYHGLGIGRAIVEHAVEIAVNRGANCVRLTVDANNKSAVRLYRSAKFYDGTTDPSALIRVMFRDIPH